MQYEEKTREELIEEILNLKKKVKRLESLSKVINLIKNPNRSIRNILRNSLDIIKQMFQYPDLCSINITFNKTTYSTKNYIETPWKISTNKLILDKSLEINVYYLEKKPFLEIEKKFLTELAEVYKAIFEFKLIWI